MSESKRVADCALGFGGIHHWQWTDHGNGDERVKCETCGVEARLVALAAPAPETEREPDGWVEPRTEGNQFRTLAMGEPFGQHTVPVYFNRPPPESEACEVCGNLLWTAGHDPECHFHERPNRALSPEQEGER